MHDPLLFKDTYYDSSAPAINLRILRGKFVYCERNICKYYPLYKKRTYTLKGKKSKISYRQTQNGYITYTQGNITYTFNDDNNIIEKEEDTEIYERKQRRRGVEQTMDADRH